jgi:hypothetical protein
MNLDIFTDISTHIDSPEDLDSFCKTSSQNFQLCRTYKNHFIKKMLKNLKVDYKDPGNLIYIYNNKSIEDFSGRSDNSSQWDLPGIYKLYMILYKLSSIKTSNYKITSIPMLPNMISCYLKNCKIQIFPSQKNMEACSIYRTKLKEFHIQPNMKNCYLKLNFLTGFPVQPRMETCIIFSNYLSSFPTQPNMTYLQISRYRSSDLGKRMWAQPTPKMKKNGLSSLNIQPKMKTCDISNNFLTSFSIQPEMTDCHVSDNSLDFFPVQPKMKVCDISNNLLKDFETQPELLKLDISNNPLRRIHIQPKMKKKYLKIANKILNKLLDERNPEFV